MIGNSWNRPIGGSQLIQIVKQYAIKGATKQYLEDCLIAYKKDTLLEIAKTHSISVKKSQTKAIIAARLAESILHQFDEDYTHLSEDDKSEIVTVVNKMKSENRTDTTDRTEAQLNLILKGYVYFFAENQTVKTIVPLELAEKIATLSEDGISESDPSMVEWFLKTKMAIENIYAYCSLSHLVNTWNKHAAKRVTIKEIEPFFNNPTRE